MFKQVMAQAVTMVEVGSRKYHPEESGALEDGACG